MTQSEHDFFDWLACSVVLADDFETNPEFYREIICRKLVRLGILKLEDDMYVLPDPSRWRGEQSEESAQDRIISLLKKQEPVIVRCKDCKYRHDAIRCRLDSEGLKTPDDWFCADGERQ